VKRIHVVQLILFLTSFIMMTVAGAEWRYAKSFVDGSFNISKDLAGGLAYSISFMLFLITHEMGHYLVAIKNKVKVTLPFFIPLWLGWLGYVASFLTLPSFGSMGAFIVIQGKPKSRKAYFDIGVAGPIAGFIVAILIILIGFSTLPSIQYIYDIHPEYLSLGENYGEYVPDDENQIITVFRFGPNLVFSFLEQVMNIGEGHYPHPNELIHYPLLMVGYIALFFTALNLLPIGQLDGGHIIYGMFGKKSHAMVSRVSFIIFLFYAGLGLVRPGRFDMGFMLVSLGYVYFLYVCLFNVNSERLGRLMIALIIFVGQFTLLYTFPKLDGYPGLLLMGFIIGRFVGIDHPQVDDESPLDLKRKVIGWVSIIIFIICISPKPFIMEAKSKQEGNVNNPSSMIDQPLMKGYTNYDL